MIDILIFLQGFFIQVKNNGIRLKKKAKYETHKTADLTILTEESQVCLKWDFSCIINGVMPLISRLHRLQRLQSFGLRKLNYLQLDETLQTKEKAWCPCTLPATPLQKNKITLATSGCWLTSHHLRNYTRHHVIRCILLCWAPVAQSCLMQWCWLAKPVC